MPFHTSAYFESVDQTLDNVAALADGVLTVSGDDLKIAEGYESLLGVYGGSANMERLRISAASLLGKVFPDLRPVSRTNEPPSPVLSALHTYFEDPIVLKAGEVLNMLAENDGAAGAEQVHIVTWLGDGPVKPAGGRWWPIRLTCATGALSADKWSSELSLTSDQRLPPGKYEWGGARVQGTSCIAARFLFSGQAHRPGTLGVDADGDIEHPIFRRGNLGVWGKFTHDQLPNMQVLPDLADNETYEIVADVRQVA